jgi:hypothetical protein
MLTNSLLYTSDPGLVLGFHGCDESVRDSIISGRAMLKASENCYDWLGYGFYFWQNSYERALDFARNPPGGKIISKPAVLGAVLSLGNCLDLTDIKHIRSVQISYQSLERSAQQEGRIMPQNRNIKGSNDYLLRELDCSVIENMHVIIEATGRTPFDSARGVFVEGQPIYQNAGFCEKTHIQICIRNPNCIKGFFIPREEMQWPGKICI